MKNPIYIALGIILSGFFGFVGLGWVLSHLTLTPFEAGIYKVLQHGCEGALVGGICDFIAVHMVYQTARDKFTGLRDNTTRVVVQEMIQVQRLVEEHAELNVFLRNPEYQKEFVEILQKIVPNQEELSTQLTVFWTDNLKDDVLDWLVALSDRQESANEMVDIVKNLTEDHGINVDHFRHVGGTILREVAQNKQENALLMQRVRALSSDVVLADLGIPSETEEVRALLQDIWRQWKSLSDDKENLWSKMSNSLAEKVIAGLSPKIAEKVKVVTVEEAIDPLLNEEAMSQTLLALAEKIEHKSPQGGGLSEQMDIMEDILAYLLVFWQAWGKLDAEVRRYTLNELITALQRPLLKWLSEALWELRNSLLNPEILLDKKIAVQLVTMVSTYLKSQAVEVEQRSLKLLQEQFDDMGPDGFVGMIQDNTKTQLDWIKVNGSFFGFLLGSLVGLMGIGISLL